MENYRDRYEHWTAGIRSSRSRIAALRLMNKVLTGLFYAAYPVLLSAMAAGRDPRLLRTVAVPAAAFAALTLIRRKINAQRPYEADQIIPLIPRDKPGESMPSRHVFSAAVIAMAWLFYWRPAGIFLLAMCLLSAGIRVLGGIHYPRDVVAGFLAGILAGLLLM